MTSVPSVPSPSLPPRRTSRREALQSRGKSRPAGEGVALQAIAPAAPAARLARVTDHGSARMFEPRLSPVTLDHTRSPGQPIPRAFGELLDPRDIAPIDEWDHAAIVQTDTSTTRLGMPPFTP